MRRRFILLALQGQRVGKIFVNLSNLRLELQRPAKVCHRLIETTLLGIDLTQIEVGFRIFGIYANSGAELFYRLLQVTLGQE